MKNSAIIFGTLFIAVVAVSAALALVTIRDMCMSTAAAAKLQADWSPRDGCMVHWHGLRLPIDAVGKAALRGL